MATYEQGGIPGQTWESVRFSGGDPQGEDIVVEALVWGVTVTSVAAGQFEIDLGEGHQLDPAERTVLVTTTDPLGRAIERVGGATDRIVTVTTSLLAAPAVAAYVAGTVTVHVTHTKRLAAPV